MDYFPAFLDLKGRSCLVVGGGDVALRKARLLQAASADITVVAPETSWACAEFIERHALQYLERRFDTDDVAGKWLVVSATGDAKTEQAVFEASTRAGVFCNSVDDRGHCSYITPAIVDRSPIVVAISSGGAAPVLARKLRERIEAMLPRDFGRLATLARRWRRTVSHRIDGLLGRRRFWEAVFDGRVADDALGGNFDRAEREMARLLVNFEERKPGQAWLVGAGPGDPELLTLRGLQVMQHADVILHDRLVSDEVLALARRDADLVPVGKAPGCRLTTQEQINERLVELVAEGKRVCRLKGGDPFVFGRGGEEVDALAAAGLDVEVVPGVTAAAGCAAAAGIPLTHRDLAQSVVLVAAHGKDSVDELDWQSLARERQTIAFYMAVKRLPEVMNRLIDGGRGASTPVAIVERGTLPQQRVIRGTLGQLTMLAEAQAIESPAVLFVGEVAALGASRAETVASAEPCPVTQSPPICAKQSS